MNDEGTRKEPLPPLLVARTCPAITRRGTICGRRTALAADRCQYHIGSPPHPDAGEVESQAEVLVGEEVQTRARARESIVECSLSVQTTQGLRDLGATIIAAFARGAITESEARTWNQLLEAQRRSLTSIVEEEVAALRDELEGLQKAR